MATEASQTKKNIDETSIEHHRGFLEEHIDPDTGLLDKLKANGALSYREITEIKNCNTFIKRNSALLNFNLAKHHCDRLIAALRETDQIHIVNYLNENGEYNTELGGDWPLTEKEVSILDTNHESLVDLLECDELLGHLYSSKVINKRQMASISTDPDSYKKNDALMDCLRRRSLRDYYQTIKCLHKTKQSHIAMILEEGGAVVGVHVKLGGGDVDQTEHEIISRFKAFSLSNSAEEISRLMAELNLIAIEKGHSVVLYFYCETLTELDDLWEMQISGKLKTIIKRLFKQLLYPSEHPEVTLKNLKSVVKSLFTQLLHRFQIKKLTMNLSEDEHKKFRSILPDDIKVRAIWDFDPKQTTRKERDELEKILSAQRRKRERNKDQDDLGSEDNVESIFNLMNKIYYSDKEVNPHPKAFTFKRGDKMKTVGSANIGDNVGWWMVKHLDGGEIGFAPRNSVVIDHTSEVQPVKTTINKLPLELLDIILQKSFLYYSLSGKDSTKKNEFPFNRLSSVDFCWLRRLNKPRLKRKIKAHLRKIYEEFRRGVVILRNNRSYLEENIQPKGFISRLRSTDCLTDVERRLLIRQTTLYQNTKKLLKKNRNPDLLHLMRSFDDAKNSEFIRFLHKSNQKFITRVADNGGVVVKATISIQDTAKRQHLFEIIKDLREKTKPRSYQTDIQFISQLKDDDIEILNSLLDRQIVVWIWCRSQTGLGKIHELNESNSLIDVLTGLTSPSSFSQIAKPTAVIICRDQFKKSVVMCPISINFTERLDLERGCEYLKTVTKLGNEIYVLSQANYSFWLIFIFEDRNPFHLRKKIDIKKINRPEDVGSNEKENCLYISDSSRENSCIWKITRETYYKYKITKWLIPDHPPYNLSVTSDGQLLVVYIQPSILEIYRSDAERLLSIQLPAEIGFCCHAVETSIGNFIIIHQIQSFGRMIDVVSEVTRDGQMVVRRFIPSNEAEKPNKFKYLSIDSDDRVFVADCDNNGVVLLDSDLKLNRIICTTKEDKNSIIEPERLYYDEETKQLIILMFQRVYVYTLHRK